MSRGDTFPEHLPVYLFQEGGVKGLEASKAKTVSRAGDSGGLVRALQEAGVKQSEAARKLGVGPGYLVEVAEKL